jgi:hypothetical protein
MQKGKFEDAFSEKALENTMNVILRNVLDDAIEISVI